MVSCKTKADIKKVTGKKVLIKFWVKLDIVQPILEGCCHDILSHFLVTANLKEISNNNFVRQKTPKL